MSAIQIAGFLGDDFPYRFRNFVIAYRNKGAIGVAFANVGCTRSTRSPESAMFRQRGEAAKKSEP